MEVAQAIRERRSIRLYQDRPVEKEKIVEVLEAARWAPSAGNTQTWRFFVVTGEDLRLQLARAALNQRHVAQAPVCIVVGFDMREMYYAYGDRGVDLYGIQDTAAAIQNMLLRAHDLGLGTCWVGAFDEEEVAEVMDLPATVRPVALVTLGYPDEKPSSTRKPLDEIVFFVG